MKWCLVFILLICDDISAQFLFNLLFVLFLPFNVQCNCLWVMRDCGFVDCSGLWTCIIVESSLWKDESVSSQEDVEGQTPSRDPRVPCCCRTSIMPRNTLSSLSSSSSCECLGVGHASLITPASSATSSADSASSSSVEPTSILPFLFLGSQRDALSSDVINVSFRYVLRPRSCIYLLAKLTQY